MAFWIQKCDKCKKETEFHQLVKVKTSDGVQYLCHTCYDKIKEEKSKKELEKYLANAPKIKCSFCDKWFIKPPSEEYRYSLESNIARGLIFIPWGVAKSIKNKPYIECPHCKMKIMQG